MGNNVADITSFFVTGINYKKTDATVRGQYAIGTEQYNAVLKSADALGVRELFVLSTCNRTEIYGISEHPRQLASLLCAHTKGSLTGFSSMSYVKVGIDAIEHLFHVGAGLDSQILGDYEIVGQIKQAVQFSKKLGGVKTFTERLVNCVLQSSKVIKNQTALSGGSVSVSFAAVQYLKQRCASAGEKKILLIGTGKIGRSTCKNLVDYLGATNITLVNRSGEKSTSLAAELGLKSVPLDKLSEQTRASDIVIVATNSDEPIIRKRDLEGSGEKLLIDLSVPSNVEIATKDLAQVTLVNVDDLSKINDATLQKREAEVPKAKEIIALHMVEFLQWHEMRRHVPLLKAVKNKLSEMHGSQLYAARRGSSQGDSEQRIQLVINGMASKMRSDNRQGCCYIEAINDFISTDSN